MSAKTEGWGPVFRSVKWHYFDANRLALCDQSKLALSDVDVVKGNDDSPDNCVKCKALLRSRTKVAK